ncbi:sporulation protein [Kitasatospora phosalacinea]|uniref:sporulation protein n=1 Tax=Kitasatospora phosalacinea TaxID=2065 RepID=UPI000525D837|nr:sporulation protein [Kitasatospora phosalacinea]
MAERTEPGAEQLEPPEVELLLDDSELTDRWIAGRVLVRAGRQGLVVDDLKVQLVADAHSHRGKRFEMTIHGFVTDISSFTLAPGEERQAGFRRQLSWECPFTEYDGRAFDFEVAVRASLRTDPPREGGIRHRIPLRIPPTAAVGATVAAFAELGYVERSARVIDERIPDSEQYHQGHQSLFLTAPAGNGRGLPRLELSFVTNQVGTFVYLRRVAPGKYKWETRPPTVTLAVAHHEVAHADLVARVSTALEELRLLDRQ